MYTQHHSSTAVLLLRLMLGALLLSHAFLGMVALGVPGFAMALTAQGIALQTLPVTLMELAAGILIIVGSRGRL